MASDFIVSFRFPCDDFFVRHETNVFAKNAKEAMATIKFYLPEIENLSAQRGFVMLYGRKWNTIKTDVKRICQLKCLNVKKCCLVT